MSHAPPRRLAVLAPWVLVLLVGALLGGSAVTSAQDAAAPALADVPSGPASLRGRIVHAERPDAAAGIEVVLYALASDGQPGSRHAQSDASGAFAFEGLANDPNVVYLLGARHEGLPFPGERVVFAEGETERTITLRISDPTEDPSNVRVLQSSLRIALGRGRLTVAEVHRLRNDGDRVVHVAPDRRTGRRAPLQAELLPGSTDFSMPLGLVPEGVERSGSQLRFWGPLYPGEQEISFRYEVPVEVGIQTLDKRFPSAADRIRIFARVDGLLEGVDGLESGDVIQEQGVSFQTFEATEAKAGFSAGLNLRIPETRADAGAVRLAESRLVLEVDDVTLQAQEQHRVEVDGSAVVRALPGELIVSLPLPEGAENIRFSDASKALGLVRTDDGVGIVGPLRPGSHGIGLAYDLRSSPEGVLLERRFDRRVPLLRVFVADTGVAVKTERLHRRRPQRDADRTYLVFEAFELDAEESLHIDLRPLPPRASSARPALAFAFVLGLGSVAFLLAPVRSSEIEEERPAEETAPAARGEREHLYETIRDLDHDFETGKLDESDWQALRAELRGRAVALLAEERDSEVRQAEIGARDGAAGGTRDRHCRSCGFETRAGDRFCADCGSRVEASRA